MTPFNNMYQCDCGCDLVFEKYSLGVEYHINYIDEDGYGRIISENRIVNISWNNYLDDFNNKTVGEFVQLIKQNKDIDNVWKHLYNEYIIFENIPKNKKISFEYCY
jgi:hypothetical protein